MKIGVWIPAYRAWVGREAVLTLATESEDRGFESLWVQDHVVAPTGDREQTRVEPIGGWLTVEDYAAQEHSAVEYYGRENWWLDPYVTWAFLAACTTRATLASCIIVLPYRDPIVQAKMLGTLDVLSGGRTLFGIGSGHVQAEFAALGLPFADRGARTDEYMRIIRALVRGEETAFEGEFVSFPEVRPLVRSMQRPSPPFYVGGNSKRSIRRAIELGEGWLPAQLEPDQVAIGMEYMRERADAAEAPCPATAVAVNWGLRDPRSDFAGASTRRQRSVDEIAALIERYAALGIDHLAVDVPNPSLDVVRRQHELLAEAAARTGRLAA